MLPKFPGKVGVPPILCQGRKTNLVKFILSSVKWDGEGTFHEPFMGSGIVGFNVAPARGLFSDVNFHIIEFYNLIKKGVVTPSKVSQILGFHSKALRERGESYYYEVRDAFNEQPDPFLFLFLNRACYNGLMRFNSKGEFNSPYNKKQLTPGLIDTITRRVAWVADVFSRCDIEVITRDWAGIKDVAKPGDFVYMDPPYNGRNSTYYTGWTSSQEREILEWARGAECGYAISLWWKNKNDYNDIIDEFKEFAIVKPFEHFYKIGPRAENKYPMTEVLIVKPGSEHDPDRGGLFT